MRSVRRFVVAGQAECHPCSAQRAFRHRDFAAVRRWYQPHLERSLMFIRSSGLPLDARIIDVGGGASTLVDDLLADGYRNVAVIDLAAEPLEGPGFPDAG